MQMSIPDIPAGVTSSVVTAVAIDVIAAIVLVSTGALFPGMIALALVVAVYWFVYRNLAEDVVAARAAAAFTAIVHAAFAVAWLLTDVPFGFLAAGAVATWLGYAFVALGRPAPRAAGAAAAAGTLPSGGAR